MFTYSSSEEESKEKKEGGGVNTVDPSVEKATEDILAYIDKIIMSEQEKVLKKLDALVQEAVHTQTSLNQWNTESMDSQWVMNLISELRSTANSQNTKEGINYDFINIEVVKKALKTASQLERKINEKERKTETYELTSDNTKEYFPDWLMLKKKWIYTFVLNEKTKGVVMRVNAYYYIIEVPKNDKRHSELVWSNFIENEEIIWKGRVNHIKRSNHTRLARYVLNDLVEDLSEQSIICLSTIQVPTDHTWFNDTDDHDEIIRLLNKKVSLGRYWSWENRNHYTW